MKPKLAVICKATENSLEEVKLEPASSFSFNIRGASSELKNFLEDWIAGYLAGNPTPFEMKSTARTNREFSLSLHSGTLFQKEVWRRLATIPFGQTLSYAQVAGDIGKPKGARAVGNACHNNRWLLLIPCHRVIHADGKIGGFAFWIEIKKRLLDFEREVTSRS